MPVLQADDIDDVMITTQKQLGRLKWTSIAYDLQEYVFMLQMLQKERITYESGYGVRKQIMVGTSDQATHSGLYDEDEIGVGNIWAEFSTPFRHTKVPYAYDVREMAMNEGAARLVNALKGKRYDGLVSLAKLMESTGWSKPDDDTDNVTPFGVPYWITMYSDGNTGVGMNGTNPVGFSSGRAGISSGDYSQWANWTAKYTDITKADLITSMREIHTKTRFQSPVPHPSYNRGNRLGIYAPYSVIAGLETVGEAQNENLGRDIASMDGKIVFRGTPITWVPQLDGSSFTASAPIYYINWGCLNIFFLKGFYMAETPPLRSRGSHNVREVWIDCTWNTEATDLRRMGVLSLVSKTGS